MKPHRNNNNIMPIIEIDDDIIDLDGQEKTPEEVVYEWDAKIRKQITEYSIAANENILVEFMKEYLKSSEDMARNYEDNDSFRRKVLCHASFFYSYFTELKCCATDNYLDIMEDILSLYCNLELKVIRSLKRKDSNKREYKRRIAAVCRRIIHVLTVYLLEKSDHMLHVLIKLNNNHNSESCIKILNVLYRHFLTEVPVTSINDESFCRTYILFQKWKQIRKTEEWQEMDETMYKMYKRNAESIRTNDTLKRLLMPTCQSTVDVLLQLFRPVRDISDAYFKHIKEKKNIDIDYIDFRIDLGEDDLSLSVNDNKEDESENDEVEFMRAYQEVEQNMSTLIRTSDSNKNVDFILQTKVKHEHEDDDVEFIGYSFLPPVQQQQKQLIVTDEDSQNSNNLNSNNNNNNNNRVKEKSSSSPTVQSKSVEVSTDIEPTLVSPSLPPPPQATTAPKVCSVSTSTENFPDSNTISDNSCVINNNNNNNNNTIVNNNNNNDNISGRKTVSTRTVETQSDEQTINKNCLYSYGLVTPPSDLPIDDHNSRTVETTCVYTDIMPTNPNIHDGNIRSSIDEDEEECISEENQAIIEHQPNVQESENMIEDYREKTLTKQVELDEFDRLKNIAIVDEIKVNKSDQIHERLHFTTETTTTTNPIQSKIIDNHDVDGIVTNPPSNHLQSNTNEAVYNNFDDREVPDTGQIKDAPNIMCNDNILDAKNCNINNKSKDNSTTLSKTSEPINGNTLIKPLNSTTTTTQNGHNNKILFTSTQTIRNTATLEEFSKFEESLNWKKTHHTDFADVLSGPISKISLNKNHQLINDEKLDFFNSDALQTKTNHNNRQQQQHVVVDNNSRSNSPNEMLSPAFETIDDFRIQDFYNNDGQINVNGGINRLSTNITTTAPPLVSPPVPPEHGILKKTHLGVTLKKKPQISFGENTFYNFYSDEKRTRSTTTTTVRELLKTDKKLQMELRVNLQRLPFIENSMKKVVESARTIRVDYDKSTPYINKNDVVRCVSPPTLSWTYRSFDSVKERLNPGKVDLQIISNNNNNNHQTEEDKALNLTIPSNELNPKIDQPSQSIKCKLPLSSSVATNSLQLSRKNCFINQPQSSPSPNSHSSDYYKQPQQQQGVTIPLISKEINSCNHSSTDFQNTPSPVVKIPAPPKFLQNSNKLLQKCLEEPSLPPPPPPKKEDIPHKNNNNNQKSSFLSNNSNFYVSQIINDKNSNLDSCKIKISKVNFDKINSLSNTNNNNNNNNNNGSKNRNLDNNSIPLPTAVPETYDFEKNLKNEVFSKIDWQTLEDFDFEETRLPLKKRKLSVTQSTKEEKKKEEEISYPATPMISIAEVEDLHLRKLQSDNSNNSDNNQSNGRPFKTPAERKEMPPLPVFYGSTNNNNNNNNDNSNEPSPIITDQFNINNHTYNNPTINYHMNNVPVPFLNIPCGSYYSLPSFIVPFNSVSTTYETGKNIQLQPEPICIKKEARKQTRQRKRN